MPLPPARSEAAKSDISRLLISSLKKAIMRVRRARKWHLVNPLSRAFASACLIMNLKRIKSIKLIKAIVRTIKELRELISREYELLRIGVKQAWKICMLVSGWGHPSAESWRNDKAFILYHAMTLKWLSRLFGRAVLNEP